MNVNQFGSLTLLLFETFQLLQQSQSVDTTVLTLVCVQIKLALVTIEKSS